MSERLLGKVCIITGTGGSIGREAALIFAREGALVIGCDVQVEAAQATVDAVLAAGQSEGEYHQAPSCGFNRAVSVSATTPAA